MNQMTDVDGTPLEIGDLVVAQRDTGPIVTQVGVWANMPVCSTSALSGGEGLMFPIPVVSGCAVTLKRLPDAVQEEFRAKKRAEAEAAAAGVLRRAGVAPDA